ncbi:MAG: BspA family leucine-rich repeat surface protein [Bifidobacterium sp.]|nr:BspA family leucine-rich repeat surface protein [Bifidobacterium sp.]
MGLSALPMFLAVSAMSCVFLANNPFYAAFRDCNSLTKLDLSRWNPPHVTTMYWMFYGCDSLRVLDMSGLDTTSNSVNVNYMFNGPASLQFFRMGAKTTWIDYAGLGSRGDTWFAEDGSWSGVVSDSSRPPTGLKWYGRFGASTSVSFNANGASGTGPGPIAGSFPLPQQVLPSAAGFSRPG